jgi:PAS domain S-box-containing protein
VDQIVVGGGEMGERIRAFDWSATPLGPVESWPQSLRSAISILLPSKAQIILFWGPDFISLYNDAYRPVFGGKHPHALGRPARECWSEVWDVLEPLFASVMRTGEAFWAKDHLFFLERHGYLEETYFDVSYDPVRDETGNVGGVFCIVSETTGRVLGERRLGTLRELGRNLSAKSEVDVIGHAAAALAENPADVPFCLFFLLDEGAAAARLVECVGLSRQDVSVADRIDLDSAEPSAAAMLAAVEGGAAREADRAIFVTSPPATASPRVLVTPILSGAQPLGLLVVGLSRHIELSDSYRDFIDLVAGRLASPIAAVRAYEQERRRAEVLAELDRAKTAFFSNVSHEFRTPLTLLLGPLEDLLRTPAASLEGRHVQAQVGVAHRSAMRMLRLVNTLLDFSRIEAGREQALYEPTDVGAYTADLASAFRSLVEAGGVRLVVDCPAGIADGFVDRAMWEKVVFNLLSNAFKHTFAGEIRVRVARSDEQIVLSVADTGTGIAAVELPHLFERFHRVGNARARTHEGTGIGLALVAELVKIHGGAIEVTSAVDRGTTFTVSIPAGSAHLPHDRIGQGRAPSTAMPDAAPYIHEARRWIVDDLDPRAAVRVTPPGDVHAGHIVLADDNADMREYVRGLLAKHWSVEAVADGAAALAAIRERPPDLVVADVMMPRLDGFQLLEAVRADRRTRTVPVMLLSARAGEESRVEGLDAGADDYLVKPFSARELVARVNAHLKMSAARRRFAIDLEHERAKLETVLRQMPAGVLIVDAETHELILTNEAAERIVGMPVGPRPDLSLGDDRLTRPDGTPYERDERPVLRSLRRGEVVADEHMRLVRDDGTVVSLSVNSAPVTGSDGRVIAAVVVFQDVTERLAMLAREQAARSEADSANRAKDRFIAVLSHELRAPLTAIIGWSRILRKQGLGEAEQAHAVTVIERNAQRQVELVNDLLDISRIAASRLELDRVAVDLAVVARDAIDSLRTELEARQLELAAELDPATGEVFGDVRRLQQIVVNLLTNAIKFTPSRGRIEVRLARHGEMAHLTVTDTGDGIDAGLIPHVFEPFRQGDDDPATRTHQGLGLGLTIVRELVTLHGGTIRVHSPGKGRGATFTVELPVVAVRVSREHPSAADTAAAHGRLRGLRILVVDDYDDARELVAHVLQAEGAETRTADSADGALALLAESPADIIVSDLAMPRVDGFGFIAAVRAASPRGAAPVRAVALTAYKSDDLEARTRAAGFDAYASKPIDPEALVDLVVRLTSGARGAPPRPPDAPAAD